MLFISFLCIKELVPYETSNFIFFTIYRLFGAQQWCPVGGRNAPVNFTDSKCLTSWMSFKIHICMSNIIPNEWIY